MDTILLALSQLLPLQVPLSDPMTIGCVYDGASYGEGARIEINGHRYRCQDGEWRNDDVIVSVALLGRLPMDDAHGVSAAARFGGGW